MSQINHCKNLELSNLNRIDANCWVLELPQETKNDKPLEIQLYASSYKIAQYSAHAIKQLELNQVKDLKDGIYINIKQSSSSEDRQLWKVVKKIEPESWISPISQAIPFTKVITDKHVIKLEISPEKPSLLNRLSSYLSPQKNIDTYCYTNNDSSLAPNVSKHNPSATINQKIDKRPFSDAFTEVSTEYFQRWSAHYAPFHELISSYKLVFRNNIIYLKPTSSDEFSSELRNENREITKLYKDFLVQEYGSEKIRIIQYRYKIDFDEMIKNGTPLYPEHIYRINIGVNNIEMEDIENLYKKLFYLNYDLKADPSIAEKKDLPSLLLSNYNFTIRELRGLKNLISEIKLSSFLEGFFTQNTLNNIQSLPADKFNTILQIINTPAEDFDKIYTGKKITHKAITGYYTIGERKFFKPWFDQQELLQIFEDLRTPNDWKNYYELASHVVVKKHLIRKHPDKKWTVGALIPAPNTPDGSPRWFYVSSCTDDNQGDFNYTLIPACDNYQGLPAIKLFRSTASDSYNMFGWDSIAADLKIAEAPGAGMREAADEYELPFFHKRTIPLWVGYFLKGKQEENEIAKCSTKEQEFDLRKKIAQSYLTAFQYLPLLRLMEVRDMPTYRDLPFLIPDSFSKKNLESLKKTSRLFATILESEGHTTQELPEYKIAQDIVFMGHSLGGALSQGAFYHFGPEEKRIPLPDHRFICYAGDPPAIATAEVENFYNFGFKHEKLLHSLNKKWQIITQMEYGDIVPMSGALHLGANLFPPESYENWLELDSSIFKPLESAESKAIVNSPTHGRRIGLAKEGLDYELNKLSPEELFRFDQSWWLDQSLQKRFGYRIVNSPKVSEAIRRIVALVRLPLTQTAKIIWEKLYPPRGSEMRDPNGYLHVKYKPETI